MRRRGIIAVVVMAVALLAQPVTASGHPGHHGNRNTVAAATEVPESLLAKPRPLVGASAGVVFGGRV